MPSLKYDVLLKVLLIAVTFTIFSNFTNTKLYELIHELLSVNQS